jgi:UDPglucose 6-dehydrogenase
MKNKVVGIVGNGFVGGAILSAFSTTNIIKVYDKNKESSIDTLEEVVRESDFIFVSVPTPMREVRGGEIDLTIVSSVLKQIESLQPKEDTVIILKSSVVPGSVEKMIEENPKLNIVYSPEFLREKTARLDFLNPSRIVLGGNDKDVKNVKSLFRFRFPFSNILVTDVTTAQMIKYMANCFLATKVSYMNEMYQIAERLGVNWEQALEGFALDGRVGLSHITVPGPDGHLGFGGKCFPKDINAMIYLFEEVGINPTVLKAAWEKNLEVREELDWASIKGAVSDSE